MSTSQQLFIGVCSLFILMFLFAGIQLWYVHKLASNTVVIVNSYGRVEHIMPYTVYKQITKDLGEQLEW